MKHHVRVKALIAFPHREPPVKPGEYFDVEPQEAVRLGLARHVSLTQPGRLPLSAAKPAPKAKRQRKGTYRRRDLVAES